MHRVTKSSFFGGHHGSCVCPSIRGNLGAPFVCRSLRTRDHGRLFKCALFASFMHLLAT